MKQARLVLANGLVMEGVSIGTEGTSVGELVFNTSMTGYQEILTDPSYSQQVVMFTAPQIGNVGVNSDDKESERCWCVGLVIRRLAQQHSNYRGEQSLPGYLKSQNIIGISEIDTRYLTHVLREEGSQAVCITTELTAEQALSKAKQFAGLAGSDLASKVTRNYPEPWNKDRGEWGDPLAYQANNKHVVAYDFGVKHNILKLFSERGIKLTVVPAQTAVSEVMNLKPDGIFLSNGPGDPSACNYAIDATRSFIEKQIPIFGICLGFQILALALGASTSKMKFGHHGGNHPVIDEESGTIQITSQNHGFMVDEASLPQHVEVTHRSLFDGTVQGIRVDNVFGFQGHPEASPGPHDIVALFDKFVSKL